MSLLTEAMTDFTIINRQTIEVGYGGYTNVWTDGATIKAVARLDNSMQARIAEKDGVTTVYTIITPKAVNLQYHDVLRRESDKKIFRVLSDGDDKKTPKTAGLDMRSVAAEEWIFPREGEDG